MQLFLGVAYVGPNVFRSSYVADIFEGSYGNQESFAKARIVAGSK